MMHKLRPPFSLRRFLPFLAWIGEIRNRQVLRTDLIAGIIVALVPVPQSMAYAQLAGLSACYGVYAAFLPPMVAALCDSPRQLATGSAQRLKRVFHITSKPVATVVGRSRSSPASKTRR